MDDELELEKGLDIYSLIDIDNICTELTDETLRAISTEVIEGYNNDKASRSSREQRMEDSMRLAMQITEEKEFPFEGCANVIIPIITIAAMEFASKAYPAIVHDKDVAKAEAIGNDEGQPSVDVNGQPVIGQDGKPQMVGAGAKAARGKRTSDFLNWQLLEQSDNWEDDTDRLLHSIPVTGNIYRKWYWSENRPESGIIYPKNFIVDYFTTDLNKARKTHIFTEYEWEIQENIRSGRYIDFDIEECDGDEAREVAPDSRKEGESSGDDESLPHAQIEQHCRLDLDKDGYPEPYIATANLASGKVVRLEANYKRDGITEKDGKIIKIRPEQYFIKYGFIPSPDGSFYDLGFGDILFSLNESINSVVNRLLDAGTLASTSSGFIGRGMKLKGGNIEVKPGQFPIIDCRGGSIRDNFVQIQHPEPSGTLFNLLGLLIDMAEKITKTNQIVGGEAAGQMAATTMLQLTEQGLTGYKAIHKRIRRSLKKEFRLLYRLNYLYLDREVYVQVLDTEGDAKADFTANGYDIVPVADMSMLTDTQRLAKSSFLLELKDDPRMDGVAILEKAVDAVGESKSLVLGNPPAQPDMAMQLQQALIEVEGLKVQAKNVETKLKAEIEYEKAQRAKSEMSLKAMKDSDEMRLKDAKQRNDTIIAAQKLENETKQSEANVAKTIAETGKIMTELGNEQGRTIRRVEVIGGDAEVPQLSDSNA